MVFCTVLVTSMAEARSGAQILVGKGTLEICGVGPGERAPRPPQISWTWEVGRREWGQNLHLPTQCEGEQQACQAGCSCVPRYTAQPVTPGYRQGTAAAVRRHPVPVPPHLPPAPYSLAAVHVQFPTKDAHQDQTPTNCLYRIPPAPQGHSHTALYTVQLSTQAMSPQLYI